MCQNPLWVLEIKMTCQSKIITYIAWFKKKKKVGKFHMNFLCALWASKLRLAMSGRWGWRKYKENILGNEAWCHSATCSYGRKMW